MSDSRRFILPHVTRSNRAGAPLTRLEVARLATIEHLDLDLGAGLNAFTGETGAGKSIIVDALGLLLGTRGGSDLVRSGAEDLLVSGFWTEPGDDEAVASRRVTGAGRSTARLAGEVVALRELGEWTGERLTIHWQHSAQSLLTPASQRALLDRRVPQEVAAYRAAYDAWRAASERLETLRSGERERARQLDLLEYQLAEIQQVSPVAGEEEPLQAELTRLSNLDAIAGGAAGALELLSDAEVSAAGLMAEAGRALAGAAKYDAAAGQLLAELREALAAVEAVSGELRDLSERSAPDPEELARVETRLAQLSKLQSKYGPGLDDVLAFRAEVEAQLRELRADQDDASGLAEQVAGLLRELRARGAALTAARTREAGPLAARVQAVTRELGMPHARLEFQLTPDAGEEAGPGAHGLEGVELRFSANPGEALGQLGQVASGGELSRVMLAISTVVGAGTPSVVFDEVDAGIGGAAATAVAAQLAALAAERQVLVVTHLAQIAARADHHYKVEKDLQGGRTVTRVRRLSEEERLAEIARMLSGNTSEAALSHARELLAQRPAEPTVPAKKARSVSRS